jgi:hypothetical protein
MNIMPLQMFFRKDINCILKGKNKPENALNTDKIFIFTPLIVNQLTMYNNTNQVITNK